MTLYDIVKDLFEEHNLFELPVMYRTWEPELEKEDMLFGYCTVKKKMSGFSIDSEDGDDYYMSDVISNYEYSPNYFKNGLVVWFESEWR